MNGNIVVFCFMGALVATWGTEKVTGKQINQRYEQKSTASPPDKQKDDFMRQNHPALYWWNRLSRRVPATFLAIFLGTLIPAWIIQKGVEDTVCVAVLFLGALIYVFVGVITLEIIVGMPINWAYTGAAQQSGSGPEEMKIKHPKLSWWWQESNRRWVFVVISTAVVGFTYKLLGL